MPGISKGYRYLEKNKAVCELCGKEFKTRSGLGGHMRFYHEPRDFEEQPNDTPLEQHGPVITPSASNKELREAVERARLQGELARYGISAPPESPISQLKELIGVAKELGGELGKDGQPQTPSWLQFLNSPNLPLIIAGLRGALGIQQGQGGDLSGIATLLQLVGAKDLKSLLGAGPVTTAPEAFDLPDGTHIPKNFPLEPNLLLAIMRTKDGDPMANALERSIGRVYEMWQSDRGGGGTGIAGKPPEPIIHQTSCSKCGAVTKVDLSDAKEGEKIAVTCKECGQEDIIAVSGPPGKVKPARVHKQKPPPPPEKDIVFCSECNQQIDVTGKPVLSEIECPACGAVGKVTSPGEPLPAGEPQKEPESLAERNR